MEIYKNDINTTDKQHQKISLWIKEISPNIAPYSHKLNLKLVNNSFLKDLDKEKYKIYLRSVNNQIQIFRKENIPLFTEMEAKQQEYGAISAKMNIDYNGEKLTMQKAEQLLKSQDRKKRKEIYHKIADRRLQDEVKLDNLFDELITLRQIAKNAGFDNYEIICSTMGRLIIHQKTVLIFTMQLQKKSSNNFSI